MASKGGEYPKGEPVPVRTTVKRTRVKGATPDLPVRMDTPRTTSVAGGGNLSSDEADKAEKARKAMEMRAAGATYAQIAKRLGYAGPGPVYGLLKRYLDRVHVEGVAEMRLVQLDRLHTMLMSVWPKVVDPSHPQSLQALDRALSVTDRITRLYGLENMAGDETTEGVTVTNSVTVGGSTAEVMAALKAMAETRKAAEPPVIDVPEAEVEGDEAQTE